MSSKKRLGSQAKEIIASVYHRLKYEAKNGVENLTDARWRTAQAVGFSETTITRILNEQRQAESSEDPSNRRFKSPTRKRRKHGDSQSFDINQLDDIDMVSLRRTIMSFHKFHSEFEESPTLKKLKQVLSERMGFESTDEMLRTILIHLGYEVTKSENNCNYLKEKHEIQMLRFTYLQQLQKYRNEGRYIVFAGETHIDTDHNQKMVSKKSRRLKTKAVIVHAGGCDGFIPNAFFMYKGISTDESVNYVHYKNWLTNQLLPNIPENSVIVMNNTTCTNVLDVNIPSSISGKNIMQSWLTEKNIPYSESMNKIELYDLILKNRDKFKTFVIDEIIKSKGFEMLRIPTYHPELNPIEKMWGLLKNEVASKTEVLNIATLMVIVSQRIKNIDVTEWENTCRLVEETEQQYLRYFDKDYDFVIHDNESDSDENNSE